MDTTAERIPIRELVRYYLRLSLLGFGGPVALLGQTEREMVGARAGSRSRTRPGDSSSRQGGPA